MKTYECPKVRELEQARSEVNKAVEESFQRGVIAGRRKADGEYRQGVQDGMIRARLSPPKPPLPVVWVKKQPGRMYWRLCDEKGNDHGELYDAGRLTNLQLWLAPTVEVRKWQPPAEEPFVEPTKYNAGYATDGEYSVGIDFAPDRITTIILQHKHGEPISVIDLHQVMTPE